MVKSDTDCPACGAIDSVRHVEDVTLFKRFRIRDGKFVLGRVDGRTPADDVGIRCLGCMTTWDTLEDYVSAQKAGIPEVLYDVENAEQAQKIDRD